MVEKSGLEARKVTEFLVSTFSSKTKGKWLSDKKKKKAFEKALEQALIKVTEAGFNVKGPGALDHSFLTNEAVARELWTKLLDPDIDEEIDYGLLEKELRGIYQDVSIGPKEVEAIEFFVDTLMDQMWSQDILSNLLTSKIIQQHDHRLSQTKKETLIREYLRAEGQSIKRLQDEEIGKYHRYIQPLIEKKDDKREREERTVNKRFPSEEVDPYTPIDMNTYFTESSDRRIIVVADSGYGKTVLLRELFMRISRAFEHKKLSTYTPIPIYFTPSQAAECSESTIANKVSIRLMQSRCRESKVLQFVQNEFQAGRFIFLIDALDQVFERQNLLGALEGRCFRDNRVVLTSRPNVYEIEKGHLANYVYLRIREFDEDRWVEYLGEEKIEVLREIVDEEFLSVPILLRLIGEYWVVGTQHVKPVENRAELLSKMLNILLTRQEEIDAAFALIGKKRSLSDVRDDLSKLAHDSLTKGYIGQFTRRDAKEILGETKLVDLESRRAILKIVETGEELAFRHRSFQEYLAAEYLNSHIKTEKDLNKLGSYLYHPNWEESLRFLTGLLNSKMAEGLIDRILHSAEGKPLSIYRDHLRLAALCLREIGEASQNKRNAVINFLRKDIKDPVLRDIAISTLTVLGGEESVEILKGLLSHKDSLVRVRAASALGEINSEVSLKSLIQALKDEDFYVRESAAYALSAFKSEVALVSLIQALKDEDSYVRRRAAYALGAIKSKIAIKPLIKALRDEDSYVRWRAADALGKIKSEVAVESLIQALMDKDFYVRRSAVSALEEIKSGVAVESLNKALDDEDSSVRRSAASALGAIKSGIAVESLIKALNDGDSSVRRSAASALGAIKSGIAVEPLIQALKDEKPSVRVRAAEALGAIKSEVTMESLIQALEDKDSDVRVSAAFALGTIKSENAVESLIQALKDEDFDVRESAAYALGTIKSEVAVESLIQALKDDVSYVRRSAAYALGAIKSENAVESLIQALKDEDSYVRWSAAEALGEIKSENAVESLIQNLKDEVSYVRGSAAEALGAVKSDVAVEPLIQALNDEDSYVRWSVAHALGVIGTPRVLAKISALWNKKDLKIDKTVLIEAIKICDRKLRSQQPIKPIG